MRVLLIIAIAFIFSVNLHGQGDFRSYDSISYNYYLKGDFKNLKRTAETMYSSGFDYYYIRMRLGILAYYKQRYKISSDNFRKAIEFSSHDTLSHEYLYYSYLFSGREHDAKLYLGSIPYSKKTGILKSVKTSGISNVFIGSSYSASDVLLYPTNALYYESVKSSFGMTAGFDAYSGNNSVISLAYTGLFKEGTVYSSSAPTGIDMNFRQNQFYGKVMLFPTEGFEFSGFGHIVSFNDVFTSGLRYREFTGGAGIAINGWKMRSGLNVSVSNFGNSRQVSGEGYVTWLPSGNLNLYFTSGGMFQNDKYWGSTYQINQVIGFRMADFLWVETGVMQGNSYLNVRNSGYSVNNSYQIPTFSAHSNLILFPLKKISLTLTPYFNKFDVYSWDFTNVSRTDRINIDSFGCAFKLTYKIR